MSAYGGFVFKVKARSFDNIFYKYIGRSFFSSPTKTEELVKFFLNEDQRHREFY